MVCGELNVQVWPMEESSDFGYTQALFNLSYIYFCPNNESRSRFVQHIQEAERNLEMSSATREVNKMMMHWLKHLDNHLELSGISLESFPRIPWLYMLS